MEKRMAQVIRMPDNFISKADREKLESFGAHVIVHGRATRWHWAKDVGGGDIFEIYKAGRKGTPIVRIRRDRTRDVFCAEDASGGLVAAGTLAHVMAVLESQ